MIESCVVVVFGAGGDLAHRKLFPALFALQQKRLLPERIGIVGTGRSERSQEQFVGSVRQSLSKHGDSTAVDAFSRQLRYAQVDVSDARREACEGLAKAVTDLRDELDLPDHVLFYLSIPPDHFAGAAKTIDACGLAKSEHGWRRLVIEKPYGVDAASSRQLDEALLEVFDEEQVFRIDHFLGKDTVQNMLLTRFFDVGFESIWNRHHVDHVQITVAETLGVETRAEFYEQTGVVRDMLQNHLLLLLSMVAMEQPTELNQQGLSAEATKVLQAIAEAKRGDWVVGQYAAGMIDGEEHVPYKDEDGVDPGSSTPTYVAARLRVENARWAGVPFYLRTGKRMARDLTEVTVQFKPVPHPLLPVPDAGYGSRLTFRMAPNEGIVRTFAAKVPGPRMELARVAMDLSYAEMFPDRELPDAYENLILDAVQGDRLLFPRAEWLEAAWRVVDPLLDTGAQPWTYPAGSWGPDQAEALVGEDGRAWLACSGAPGVRIVR